MSGYEKLRPGRVLDVKMAYAPGGPSFESRVNGWLSRIGNWRLGRVGRHRALLEVCDRWRWIPLSLGAARLKWGREP